MSLLHEELCYKIIGCFYDVRNRYGMHHKEKPFDRFLSEEFDLKKIRYVSQPRINTYSLLTGRIVAVYIPDYLVEDLIVVEIKALPFTSDNHTMQLCEYLKTSQYEVGYLVNFGEPDFKPRRFISTNDRKPFLTQKINP